MSKDECGATEKYIMLGITSRRDDGFFVEEESTSEERRREYKLKRGKLTAENATAYCNALRAGHERKEYNSTTEVIEELAPYCMVTRVPMGSKVGSMPPALCKIVEEMGWECNCLDYCRKTQCGHVLFARWIDRELEIYADGDLGILNEYSFDYKDIVMKVIPNKPRTTFNPRAPKQTGSSRGDFVDTHVLGSRKRKSMVGGKTVSAPLRSSFGADFSMKSPKSERGHSKKKSTTEHAELESIILHLRKDPNDDKKWVSWTNERRRDGDETEEFAAFVGLVNDDVTNDMYRYKISAWYLARYFYTPGTLTYPLMLSTICSNKVGSAGDTRVRKPTEKSHIPNHNRVLTHVTDEKNVTMKKVYENLFNGNMWLSNEIINALCDQVQYDLKLAGKECAILSTKAVARLRLKHENTLRVKDVNRPDLARCYQEFLRSSKDGRQVEWYIKDSIYFPRKGFRVLGFRV